MKKLLCLIFFMMLVSNAVQAEIVYIREIMTVTFRSGPGTDHRVVSTLKTGQEMELISKGEQWSKVLIADGKEGWVLNQYLSNQVPSSLKLAALENKYQKYKAQTSEQLGQFNKLQNQNKKLSTELSRLQKEFNELKSVHNTLQKESAEFLELKSNYEKSVKDLDEQIQQSQGLENELKSLRLNDNIWWFLTGAGVLLFGFMIGLSVNRRKRRRSSLNM